MKRIYCTIITPDYFQKAITLYLSIKRVNSNINFVILTTGELDLNFVSPDIRIIRLFDLSNSDKIGAAIIEKYSDKLDEMRWSLKPVLLRYLLLNYPNSETLYCDCDFCFFGSPDYLFNLLQNGGIVLTPHWRPLNPTRSINNFRLNFCDGLFNAGCITANVNGIDALEWWAEACLSACEVDREKGLFYDQRYLDLMLVYFPEAIICRHQGYNVADWNFHLRAIHLNEKLDVPNKWPIVLVHFTANTVKKIERGTDPILNPFYLTYQKLLSLAHEFVSNNLKKYDNIASKMEYI